MNKQWKKLVSLLSAVLVFLSVLQVYPAQVEAATPIKDGEYAIDFKILTDNQNSTSVMDEYTAKPATLVVEGGKQYVYVTLKNSNWITSFQTELGGVMVDSEIVEPDTFKYKDGNVDYYERKVKFEVTDLTAKLNAQTHVKIPDGVLPFPYDNDYTVQIQFNPTGLNDAKQNINFVAIHGTDNFKSSSMNSYFLKPALHTIREGIDYVSFTVKDSSTVRNVKVKQAGVLTEARTLSVDNAANTRVIEFPVENLTVALDAQVHISTTLPTGGAYEMDHNIRLLFNPIDKDSLDALVTSAETAYNKKDAGTDVGQYPESAKTALKNAIDAAKEKGTWFDPQTSINAAITELNAAFTVYKAAVVVKQGNDAPSTGPTTPTGPGTPPAAPQPPSGQLDNGIYSIDFTILKQGANENSVMDGYVVHPATLTVSGSSKTVTMRFTQSKEITGFRVEGSTIRTVGSNAEKNTRDVSFEVSDLNQTLNGWVKIVWPEFNYNHEYSIQIQLGSISDYVEPGYVAAPSIPGATPTPTTTPTPTPANAGGGKDTATKPTPTPDNKLATAPVQFTDTSGHWAAAAIAKAVNLGIINGYSDGKFQPNATITRAEFTAIIGRALKLEGTGEALKFKDQGSVPAWAKGYVEQAVAAGIIGGYEDETFRPSQQVNRADISVMMVRALNLPLEKNVTLSFADANQIPAYAKPYVAVASKQGLVGGRENNLFAPKANATRAEAVALILRTLDAAAASK